ncbi:hypothetical protein LFE_2183 [Leptospirillum ferrooxidans C2-3]|uniref:Uncharacterized protein n=2 Tax=Leptospirillum ferrooxidans TaxID=180 RepID=I0IRF7_LEPFC|nr:hypothetical protein LFE_2183 [Leptospirillum ferrooxidans C2-3]
MVKVMEISVSSRGLVQEPVVNLIFWDGAMVHYPSDRWVCQSGSVSNVPFV